MSIFVEKTLYSGRPESDEGLTVQEIAAYDLLEKLQIDFERAVHEPASSVEECLEVEKVIGVRICKNLFLTNRQQSEFYLLMMPGDKPFKTSVISKIIGSSRLSFGTAELMEEHLGLSPGSVSVLGLMNDRDSKVKLVIDKEVLSSEFIRCHPCKNTATLKIKTRDLLEKILPAISHAPKIIHIPYDS